MKKSVSITLALLLCLSLQITAFATSDPTMETTIYYPLDAYYVVQIPAFINLQEETEIPITASAIVLNPGEKVCVRIDAGNFINGTLPLFRDGQLTGNPDISVDVLVGTSPEDLVRISETDNNLVATFDNGSLAPSEYGYLCLQVHRSADAALGEYYNTLCFQLNIE